MAALISLALAWGSSTPMISLGHVRLDAGDVLELPLKGKESIGAADVNDEACGRDLDLRHRFQSMRWLSIQSCARSESACIPDAVAG